MARRQIRYDVLRNLLAVMLSASGTVEKWTEKGLAEGVIVKDHHIPPPAVPISQRTWEMEPAGAHRPKQIQLGSVVLLRFHRWKPLTSWGSIGERRLSGNYECLRALLLSELPSIRIDAVDKVLEQWACAVPWEAFRRMAAVTWVRICVCILLFHAPVPEKPTSWKVSKK